jgi:hypothetical protein
MKKFSMLFILFSAVVFVIWFARQLNAGSDGAWMFLGVIGTLAIYIVFSTVDFIKDRQRARWGQMDSANNILGQHIRQLQDVSRAQGQQIANQQKIGRLGPGPGADDLLGYDDALDGEVLELPNFSDSERV